MTNPSGLIPLEFNVILKPDPVDGKTPGGIILPETMRDREKHRTTRGTVVAVSPFAFNEDVLPADAKRPEPGDRVVYALHAGATVEGEDGEEYRVVKDKDVVALIGEAA